RLAPRADARRDAAARLRPASRSPRDPVAVRGRPRRGGGRGRPRRGCARRPPDPAPAARCNPAGGMSDRLGRAVLIVEDDEVLRGALSRGLREEGFVVEAVATGVAALERVEAMSPDGLVVDIGLPDTDGRDLCQALRARGIQTPVLFLTARDAL